ncbi:DUF5374 domain-containing protein [Pasteurellaceae bacterium LIM206]|nr:DUF5374 domain-containing protein [Pasteurellaceae bacterium LIM206]
MISFLLALSSFTILLLAVQQWGYYQRQSAVLNFQFLQAVQIAENQLQRQYLGLSCEKQVRQNEVGFTITQCDRARISVHYPAGEFNLEIP